MRLCIGKCGCILLGIIILLGIPQSVLSQQTTNVSLMVYRRPNPAGGRVIVAQTVRKVSVDPQGTPLNLVIMLPVSILLGVWDHGADNCPGGTPEAQCATSPSTRWEVRTQTTLGSGILEGDSLQICVIVPGTICEYELNSYYRLIGGEACGKAGLAAEGPGRTARSHDIEFMESTTSLGSCCITGDCFDELNEEQCDLLGGTYMGDGTFCEEVECVDTIPTLTEWGMIIFSVLLFGWMAQVIMRRRKRITVGY